MLRAWSEPDGFAFSIGPKKPEPVSTGFALCNHVSSERGGLGSVSKSWSISSSPRWGVVETDRARDGLKPRRYTRQSLLKQTESIGRFPIEPSPLRGQPKATCSARGSLLNIIDSNVLQKSSSSCHTVFPSILFSSRLYSTGIHSVAKGTASSE